ncbi:MAG: TraR/DksA family transcriptional regulator [Acidimicrobiales bacterium]
MDHDTAKARLNEEKQRLQELLAETNSEDQDDIRVQANDQGDWTDPQVSLTMEEQDDAIIEGLAARLAMVERALGRLDDGTYGRSLASGLEIPDDRLDADPAAEITADEALEE